ncbi:hypothetical protein QRX50_34270 [Amycolatopsis carbonis]|uniref:Uncharacterized protein n=1 Tax=Amycolatopsis carbonis TaxID=715471 RepID=A0A9Y2ICK7_9PSEU|nr:hypothetical protein [Amycolatopsis sp. 2-15]WIX76506.1 hypothetical protein QRX50_34270 [Amycolatopsis sp. 2-15]
MDDERPMSEPHPVAADEDSSGNHPPPARRAEGETPLEDEQGRSRRGHPSSTENFRGGD